MENTCFLREFIVFMIVGLVIMSGCDVFDLEENPKSFISPENFFNTPSQIESILAGTMRRSYSNWGGYSYQPALHVHDDQLEGGNLVITQNHGSGIWSIHWSNIKDINHAIAAMVKGNLAGESVDIQNQLMGQLKFLRAWNYFQLVRHWGKIPVLTENETDNYFTLLPSRESIADVYNFIERDLLEAIDKLPLNWGILVGRPTKEAAKGLLAKVYITRATAPLNDGSYYQKAANMAKEVIDAKNYRLVEDINKVFSFETEDGPEMMWSFQANDEHRATDPRVWSAVEGWGDYSCDSIWANSYPEQPRKYAYLEFYNRDGVYHNVLGRGIGIKKYLYDTWENFDRGVSRVHMPIIRYADVLLIFAEAENAVNGGPTQAAVDAINQVINRANGYVSNPSYPLLTVNMTRDEFDKAVINERSYELCFEYDRWPDIVRKRILQEVTRKEYLVNFSEDDYLFPIPESDVRLNPNMEQNPGYSGGLFEK